MPGDATIQKEVLDLLEPGQCLTMDELSARGPLNRRQVSNGAAGLIRRGFVERADIGCYQLTRAGIEARESGVSLTSGPRAPLTGRRRTRKVTFAARLWKAMRAMRSFTVDDLVALAVRAERDPLTMAYRYVKAMERAGYVLATPRRKPGTALTSNGHKHYILVRDTGPEAPVLSMRHRAILDPNTGDRHPLDQGTGGEA